MTSTARGLDVFYLYRNSPLRRQALREPAGSAHRYVLFGLDQHVVEGVRARHNLEQPGPPPWWAKAASRGLGATIATAGGYGGDFAHVLPSVRAMNEAAVVFSTVDTVGLPLVLLRRAGLVRRPVVYAAIGLPERLARLRGSRIRRLYRSALDSVSTIVVYSRYEADVLRKWLGGSVPVEFVPFGVDTDWFRPDPDVAPAADVVSIGADPHRDFRLLLEVAARSPGQRFRIVTTAAERNALRPVPDNVEIRADIPFPQVRDELAAARVVALPVRANSYSGATTVLLQAMAMGKPIVVSRTEAIGEGYGLDHGKNCLLVEPGDAGAFGRAVGELLDDETTAQTLGAQARKTAVRVLSWDRYSADMLALLRGAAG
jgi:glycosyltransferase involved in cell wall biosynthesis